MTCNHCKDEHYSFPTCQGTYQFKKSIFKVSSLILYTACRCDETGSKNNICNKMTGECDCNPHVRGDLCDECAENHYGFPTCKPCRCNKKGSKNDACNIDRGDCDCLPNVSGKTCDKCQRHYFGTPPDCKGTKIYVEEKLKILQKHFLILECKCYAIGTKENTTCSDTGKCTCKMGYAGDKCDTCDKGYFKQSDGVCKGNNTYLSTLRGILFSLFFSRMYL